MRSNPVIAVVGAGFCGVVATILLLRSQLPSGTRVVLLERPGHGIGGVAYDPSSDGLLLNVPAERMSAFVDAPEDFTGFLSGAAPTIAPGDFAPRHLYGRYLAARLDGAAFGGSGAIRLEPSGAEVLEVASGGRARWQLTADAAGERIRIDADAVLLATGGCMPETPPWLAPWMRDEGLYVDAWGTERTRLAGAGPVLTIGTGLSFIDMLSELRASGYRGRIVAISRHGRLPRAERGPPPPPEAGDAPPELGREATARGLTRAVTRHAGRLAERGRDYRALIAALRPHTARLWARLAEAERARFLRHARSLWDVHRHRMPQVLAEMVETELAAGTLEIIAGRVLGAERSAQGLAVSVRRRGHNSAELMTARRVINCGGAAAGAPLGTPWPGLIERGLARRDSLGIGILTDPAGRLLGRQGAVVDGLYYAGPLWRAQNWEMTAVPELRARLPAVAAAIAGDVVRHLDLA